MTHADLDCFCKGKSHKNTAYRYHGNRYKMSTSSRVFYAIWWLTSSNSTCEFEQKEQMQLHTTMQNYKQTSSENTALLIYQFQFQMRHKIHQRNWERQGVIVHHTENCPTVLRGQSKQFPIPKEKRGTKEDHEGFFSVKFAVWILRGVQSLVSARPMKTGVLTYSWLKKQQTALYWTIWSKWM